MQTAKPKLEKLVMKHKNIGSIYGKYGPDMGLYVDTKMATLRDTRQARVDYCN